jgi:hypothetical protein
VTDELECIDCSTFLGDLTALQKKYASKVEELNVLRVELDEIKSRTSLLVPRTSCSVLHENLNVSLAYVRSLEAKLKAPIPTSCSTCEINVVKNLELTHYVNRLQEENVESRKMMSWLSGLEPQLRMMIEAYKHYDGQALGSDKIGECSGENEEKIGDIPAPPKTFHKNAYAPKPNPLRNRLDTTPDLLCFLHKPTTSKNPSSSGVTWGSSSLGRRRRNRVRRSHNPKRARSQSQNQSPSIVSIVGGMGIMLSFASRGSVRRGFLGRWQTRTGTTLLGVCLSLV